MSIDSRAIGRMDKNLTCHEEHLHGSSSAPPAICGSSDVEDRFCNSSLCSVAICTSSEFVIG